MEIGWWKRDEEGRKYQVHLELFGRKLRWRWQRARFERWEDYPDPTDEDWERALELAENRYNRRLITREVLEMIRERRLK
ncbi:MAG: hypothetical protein D6781_09080 [Verrucomicrobia bacterium]|nr:MAG: hypothetical protein D6781_09080 [Verrucomicrobiota bacterium]